MLALNQSMRTIYQVKGTCQFLKFIYKPTNTTSIFEMTESFQRAAPPEVVQQLVQTFLGEPEIKRAFETKYWPEVPSLEELKTYPSNSFGYAAYLFYKETHLDIDFFPKPNFKDMPSYITSRIYQAHDFWHVLTGYDTSLEHEMALQAFGVGQYKQPISMAIIAGGIIHLMQTHPEKSERILSLITEGYQRGLGAANLLAVPVLERLYEPLDQVRADLKLIPSFSSNSN